MNFLKRLRGMETTEEDNTILLEIFISHFHSSVLHLEVHDVSDVRVCCLLYFQRILRSLLQVMI